MGRLMDSVMAALGLKQSDRVTFESDTGANKQLEDNPKLIQDAMEEGKNNYAEESKMNRYKIQGFPTLSGGYSSPKKPISESETVTKEDINDFNDLVKHVKPERDKVNEKGDCLECKVMSGLTGAGITGYLLYIAKTNPAKMTGFRLACFRIGITSTTLLLGATFAGTIFGEGMTEEERKAYDERTAIEQLKFEMNYMTDYIAEKFSRKKDTESEEKKDTQSSLNVDKS